MCLIKHILSTTGSRNTPHPTVNKIMKYACISFIPDNPSPLRVAMLCVVQNFQMVVLLCASIIRAAKLDEAQQKF